MSGIYRVRVGDRGRLVIPAELREKAAWSEGRSLVLFETPGGVVMLTRDQLKGLVRSDLEGVDLVGELLAERRRLSGAEDAA